MIRTLSEVAAELRADARELRKVAGRVRSRPDLEGYYLEREDLADRLGMIADTLDDQARQAEAVARQLGEREARL